MQKNPRAMTDPDIFLSDKDDDDPGPSYRFSDSMDDCDEERDLVSLQSNEWKPVMERRLP